MALSATFHRYQDVAFLILRLVLASIFLYAGTMKLGMWSAAPEGMPPMMLMLMRILSIVEPLAGIALIIGTMTEIASLAIAIIMIGAIYVKITMMGIGFMPQDMAGWSFDLVLLAGALALLCTGAGAYSLDRSMKK